MAKQRGIIPEIRARWRRLSRSNVAASPLREALAAAFLSGEGIEIGALHQPLIVPKELRVRYVDRMNVAGLRKHYPELHEHAMAPVDVIDDGEKLAKFQNASQDFIIANHFIEHTENPIGAIERFMQLLKPGGRLYLAVPDKRWTFDSDRPVTPLEHLYRDYREGPAWSRLGHFREWCERVEKLSGAALEAHLEKILKDNYSIHFHVWTRKEFFELLSDIAERLKLPFELTAFAENRAQMEVICILTRT